MLQQVTIGAVLLNLVINIFAAESFSRMNSYMFLIQFICYTIMLLDFKVPESNEDFFDLMLTIA